MAYILQNIIDINQQWEGSKTFEIWPVLRDEALFLAKLVL